MYLKEYNLTTFVPVLDEIFNLSNPYLNDFFVIIINTCSGYSSCVLDNIINILNYTKQHDKYMTSFILENIAIILNAPGVEKLFRKLHNYHQILYDIFEKYMHTSIYLNIFVYLKNLLEAYKLQIYNLIFDLVKNYQDLENSTTILFNFVNDNPNFIKQLEKEFNNMTILKAFEDVINFKDPIVSSIKSAIFSSPEIVNFWFGIIRNKEIIRVTIQLLRHFGSNEYPLDDVPNLINAIKSLGEEYYKRLLNIALIAIKRMTTQEIFTNFITLNFMQKVEYVLKLLEILPFQITDDCKYLIDTIFFKNEKNLNSHMSNIRLFYIYKFLLTTTKDQNDLLTYENCLRNEIYHDMEHYNFTVQPTFVVAIVDDIKNKSKLTGSILNEKYNYLLGYCLPYGIYKDNSKESTVMCNDADYSNIIGNIMRYTFNMNTANIKSFKLLEINEFEISEYFYCIISLIIISIPILIIIFLYCYKMIKTRGNDKNEIINKLISEKDNNNRITNYKKTIIDISSVIRKKKFVAPKWYKSLKHFFDFKDNSDELFNFNMDKTEYNNITGLTYIKGIQAISMILYVFGQTFLILCNYPAKDFSIYFFYSLITNEFYGIIFIALRYSPRVLFSCSGYSLVFKYLCFIDQGYNLYFLKFFLLQSYKYILLVFIAVYIRYSIYYIDMILFNRRRPMLELYRYNMRNSDENYIENFFTFLLNYYGNIEFKNRQNIIQYFYIPLNEIFFFIVGTILISLGTKYKLRIDFIIIFIFLVIYLFKIFFFAFDRYENHIYSTLYFYLYEYGAVSLKPIFNLPYFLIGMYFSLINYSIQKGIVIYKKDKIDKYSKLMLLKTNQDDENEFSINDSAIEDEKLKKIRDEKSERRNSSLLFDYIFNEENKKESEDKKSNSAIYKPKKKKKNESFNKKNKNNSNEEKINDKELDENIKEKPFLICPTKILNFHKEKTDKWYFKMVVALIIIIIALVIIFIYIFTKKYKDMIEAEKDYKKYLDNISLENFITNYLVNILYSLDIELVVLLINWSFFVIYSKKSKKSDLFDFMNNIYWSFFTKSYFSFMLISSPIIIYIFYQSETFIKLNLSSVFLFSCINLFFILILDIIFYCCFELPLKKIFKSIIKLRVPNTSLDLYDDTESSICDRD